MKAVLVIDMPKSCGDCPCSGEEFGMCQAVDNEMECDYYSIPSWCPLRPLPQARNEHCCCNHLELESIINAENRGFNRCLRKIKGEKDGSGN